MKISLKVLGKKLIRNTSTENAIRVLLALNVMNTGFKGYFTKGTILKNL